MPNTLAFRINKAGHKHRSAKDSASSPRPAGVRSAAAAVATVKKRLSLPSLVPRAVKHWRRREPLPHANTCARPPRFRALIIGIDYEGTEGLQRLRGPHRDAHNFRRLLREKYGWVKRDITLMLDSDKYRGTKYWPSRTNMEERMKELVADNRAGDVFVMFYAGHSGQVPAEKDEREADGLDEHMISIDGLNILDDRLRELLVQPLCNGTRLTAIFDSCHSGTLLDLSLYPVQSRKSDIRHDRTPSDIEPVVRSNSLPASLPTHICTAMKELKKFSWMPITAFTKWYGAAMRNARIQGVRIEQAPRLVEYDQRAFPPPLIVVDTVSGDPTMLNLDSGATSDVSSILTDTLSESPHGELSEQSKTFIGASTSGPTIPNKRSSGKPSTCHHCKNLEKQSPIVISIGACLDGQQAGERPKTKNRKHAGIMTSALIELLTEKPGLSCREIKEQLQPKIFDICCGIFKDIQRRNSTGNVGSENSAEPAKEPPYDMSWQILQPGSERDDHLNEPFLVFASRRQDTWP